LKLDHRICASMSRVGMDVMAVPNPVQNRRRLLEVRHPNACVTPSTTRRTQLPTATGRVEDRNGIRKTLSTKPMNKPVQRAQRWNCRPEMKKDRSEIRWHLQTRYGRVLSTKVRIKTRWKNLFTWPSRHRLSLRETSSSDSNSEVL